MGPKRKTPKVRKQADTVEPPVGPDPEPVGGDATVAEDVDDAPQVRMNVEDQMFDFFEAHPCFYAKDSGDYKNRDRKTKLLEDFAKEPGHGYTGKNMPHS